MPSLLAPVRKSCLPLWVTVVLGTFFSTAPDVYLSIDFCGHFLTRLGASRGQGLNLFHFFAPSVRYWGSNDWMSDRAPDGYSEETGGSIIRRGEQGLWGQKDLGSHVALPFSCCVTLGKWLYFSAPSFLHLQNLTILTIISKISM